MCNFRLHYIIRQVEEETLTDHRRDGNLEPEVEDFLCHEANMMRKLLLMANAHTALEN